MQNRRQCRRGRSACAASTRAHPAAATRWTNVPLQAKAKFPCPSPSSSSTGVVNKNCGTPSSKHCGAPIDQADDRFGSVVMRVFTPRRRRRPGAAAALPLLSDFFEDGTRPNATGSRHREHPAHAGVGRYHTTVDSLELLLM